MLGPCSLFLSFQVCLSVCLSSLPVLFPCSSGPRSLEPRLGWGRWAPEGQGGFRQVLLYVGHREWD